MQVEALQGAMEAQPGVDQSIPAPATHRSGPALAGMLATLFKLRVGALIAFTAVGGAVVATRGTVALPDLVVLVIATGLTSAGAGCLNHYLDRDIDGVMERTRRRPLPAGQIHRMWTVPAAGFSLIVAGLLTAVAALNVSVAIYGLAGTVVYIGVYTAWLKRRSSWNIVIGGAAGSAAVLAGGALGPSGADLAVWALAGVVFLWTPPHFWSLAIAYTEDYRRAGIPMLPVVAGPRRTAWAILASTALLVAVTILPAAQRDLGRVFLLAALAAGSLLAVANIRLLQAPSRREALRNFHLSNAYLLVIFLAAIVSV